jgi:hypothetical protein
LRLHKNWLNYGVFDHEETEYGKPRQAKEGTEETQETAGSETGALSQRKSPRNRGLSVFPRRAG